MSVRRLAESAVQPASFAFNAENSAWAQKTIQKYPEGRQQSAVIPLMMRAQEQEGWVTKAAIEHIADMLEMPYIRALEVATFYTQFQIKPVGTRAHIQVCGTTPCMLRGSEALMDVCRSKIHPEPLHPNDDGTLSWEEVECQGACVNAPMVMIFKDSYEDLTPERLAEIIDAFDAGKGADVPAGPQDGRTVSSPKPGLTSLSDEKAILKTTRDRQAAEARAAEEAGESVGVAPSETAKPKADAPETSAAPKPVATKPSKADKPALDDPRRPVGIEKPETSDDLKLISGVGPKIEGILQSLGIHTFAQIATWNDDHREWVDSYLNFKGRIDRDEWVKQAEALHKGGVEEYTRVFGKKPV